MEWVFLQWQPDFMVTLVTSFLAVLVGGVMAAGLFWVTGYVLQALYKVMKGG